MPRRARSLLPDGCYHVFCRGVAQANIFLDQLHFSVFMDTFEGVTARFEWNVHRYCLIPNHYHLVVQSTRPDLSRGMHRLNFTYAQWFNKLHDRVGHLFQGRFGAYIIETDRHYAAVLQYVDQNPVRAGLCVRPEEWPWSSVGSDVARGP
jgi:REP-associated tyrosine transposase